MILKVGGVGSWQGQRERGSVVTKAEGPRRPEDKGAGGCKLKSLALKLGLAWAPRPKHDKKKQLRMGYP